MSEYMFLILAFMKLTLLGIIACLYALAGRGKTGAIKIRRRWAIPLVLCLGTMFFAVVHGTFRWAMVLSLPVYMFVMHIGYGHSSVLRKAFGKLGQRMIILLLS